MIEIKITEPDETNRDKIKEWEHGAPMDFWFDKERHLCIKYEDGTLIHYQSIGGELFWW